MQLLSLLCCSCSYLMLQSQTVRGECCVADTAICFWVRTKAGQRRSRCSKQGYSAASYRQVTLHLPYSAHKQSQQYWWQSPSDFPSWQLERGAATAGYRRAFVLLLWPDTHSCSGWGLLCASDVSPPSPPLLCFSTVVYLIQSPSVRPYCFLCNMPLFEAFGVSWSETEFPQARKTEQH